jgi:DNA-binding SARP family transcriptional activator
LDAELRSNHPGVRAESEGTASAAADAIRPQSLPLIELTTLGAAELRVRNAAGEVAALLGPGKPLGLITYLALIAGHSATRDHLLDLFWSDLEPEGGRHALRQTLWYLKRRLGVSLLTSSDSTVALTMSVASDRDRFIEAAETDALEVAVELYTGDFLPQFALPGGAEFEHWADLERERLRATFVRSAERLTRHWLSVPRPREAVALARRTRDAAPNAELTWRLLLEALISSRDHVGAMVEADALERRLNDEKAGPDSATRALMRAARRQTDHAARAAKSDASSLTAELVGREAEFARLLSAVTESRDGRARHLHVSGRAGIGKSRLISDVEARLRARRTRVASVRARPGDRQIPFSLLAELALALGELSGANGVAPEVASTLVTLNPRLSSVFSAKPAQAREPDLVRTRSLAISELLASVAEDGAIALFVDDVHWADEESQRALGSALGRLSGEHVLAVTASRQGFMPSFDLSAAEPITLAPLTAAQVGAMVASLGTVPEGIPADELSKRMQGATHGSPLLILELLESLIESGAVGLEHGEWRVHNFEALTSAIMSGSAIYHRLAGLPVAEQRVILASSLAGVPLPLETYARAVGIDARDLEPLLNDLERRGLVVRNTSGWQPAHDEIAEAMAELSPIEERAHAHRRLARALAELRTQPVQLIRAARQFMIVEDEQGLDDVFSDWLAAGRGRNDARSAVRLASDFLGEESPSPRARRLAARAPFFVRHPPNYWYAAAAAVLVLATTVLSMRAPVPAPPPPDAVLLARTEENGKAHFSRLEFRREEFDRADVIDLKTFGRRSDSLRFAVRGVTSLAFDGRIVSARNMTDSGGIDLFVTDKSGATRRVTTSRGDDVQPSWSPDGRFIAFSTARWDSLSHYSLALLDPRTLAVRRLTQGPYSDGAPHWSPDGTRIVFARRAWDGSPDRLCIVTPAGDVTSCANEPNAAAMGVMGWYDSHRVVVQTNRQAKNESVVQILDLDEGNWTTLRRYASIDADLSPDGKWVLCYCSEPGRPPRTRIWPVESPADERDVRAGPVSDLPMQLHWVAPLPHARYLDSVNVDIPTGGVALNAPHQLSAHGRDQTGAGIDLQDLTWSSPDTAIATVSPNGLLIPKRDGRVRVNVSAGGWRTAQAWIEVVAPSSHVAFSTRWVEPLERSFVLFGDPKPAIVDDKRFGRAFFNRGDGSFNSGIYSSAKFDARDGLGVEAWISEPQTMTQWQLIEIALSSSLDEAALATWDHRTGSLPRLEGAALRWCGAAAPPAEGPASRNIVRNTGDEQSVDIQVPSLSSGAWIQLRVQLFPDGSCGVAINGEPRSITRRSSDLSAPFRLILDGNSYATKVLVGPLEVWRGVRNDIDWRRLPR